MDSKKKRTKRYPVLERALRSSCDAIEEDGKKYPVEEELVESNYIIVDLEDNYIKKEPEENEENPVESNYIIVDLEDNYIKKESDENEENPVESNYIIVDLEDNYIKKESEENEENPEVTEELERANKMYETGKDPVKEEVVESNYIIVDLEDNYIRKESEENHENPEVTDELERAKKMYETGKDPFEEARKQAILRYVQNESRGVVPAQNTETIASSHQGQPSIDTPSPKHLSCTKCQYATAESCDFINHWLKHRTESYEKSEATPLGAFTCEEEKCSVKTTTKSDLLRHVDDHNLCNYQCDFCPYVTYFRRDLLEHSALHKIYQCTQCKLQSTKKIFVQLHLTNPWICSKCGFAAHHWFVINKHIFSHVSSSDSKHKKHSVPCEAVEKTLTPLSKCKFCDCEFTDQTFLGRHEALHIENGPSFKCRDCANYEAYNEDFGDTAYQCPYCSANKNNFRNLHSHILQRHPVDLQLDGFRYANESDESNGLNQNGTADAERIKELQDNGDQSTNITKREERKIAEDDSALEESETNCLCPICLGVIRGKAYFERHLADKHCLPTERIELIKQKKVEVLQYHCDFCYYMTLSEQDYAEHRKTHVIFKCTECSFESTKQLFVEDHTEDTYTCKECGFNAHHWLLVKKHSFRHTSKSSPILSCTFCKFTTSRPATLFKHRATHEKLEIQCHICHFKTKDIICLQKHFISCHETILELKLAPNEEEDELHKCKFCECKFKHPIYLHKHQALHTENGPNFKCSQCIHSKERMTRSLEKKNEPWKCPYCGYYASNMDVTMDHMAQRHEEDLSFEGYRFKKHTSSGSYTGTGNNSGIAVTHAPADGTTIPTDTTKHKGNDDIEADRRAMIHLQVQEDLKKVFNTRTNDTPEESVKVIDIEFTSSGAYTRMADSSGIVITHVPADETLIKNKKRRRRLPKSIHDKVVSIHYMRDTQVMVHPQALQQKRKSDASITDTLRKDIKKVNTEHPIPSGAFHAEENENLSQAQSDQTVDIKTANIQETSGSEEALHNSETFETLDPNVIFIEEKNENLNEATTPYKWIQKNVEDIPYLKLENRWHCSICTYSSKLEYFVRKHKCRQFHVEKKSAALPAIYSCKFCQYTCNTIHFLSIHVENHHVHENPSDVIDLTDDDYNDKAEIEGGMTVLEPVGLTESKIVYSCHICMYSTENKQALAEHMEASHGLETVDMHGEKAEMVSEPREPTKPKVLLCCQICFHTFENNDQLEEHMATHEFQETVETEVKEENEALDIEVGNEHNMNINHNAAEVEIKFEAENDGNQNSEGLDGMHKLLKAEITENEATTYGEAESVEDLTQENDPLEETSTSEGLHKKELLKHTAPKHPHKENTLTIGWYCPVCDYTSNSEDSLNTHLAAAHRLKRSQKNAGTKYQSGHVRPGFNGVDSKWYCAGCSYSYTADSKILIEQHIALKHPVELEQWVCLDCNYTASIEYMMKEHSHTRNLTTMSTEDTSASKYATRWTCVFCNFSTTKSRYFLNKHKATHHKQDSFRTDREKVPCKQAGCRFKASSVDELSVHMAQHLQSSMKEALTYKCERCGFGSLSKTIFNHHRRRCTKITWYKCYYCDYRRKKKSDLRNHLKYMHKYTYKRKKGFECKKCGFRIRTKDLIDLHYKRNYSKRCVEER